MTIDGWLREAQQTLQANGIESARIDSILLLEYVLGVDRTYLFANPNFDLSPKNEAKLNNVFSRRLKHEPIAYIRGCCEFYGYNFLVNSNVLIPRPESENIINILKTLYNQKVHTNSSTEHNSSGQTTWSLADIGTGCGALGISAKLELQNLTVDLIDIDEKALKVAKSNVDKFTLNLSILKSDLLIELTKSYDLLLCNLPYVPDEYEINPAAGFEPKIALFGGPDGLDVYRKLFKQLMLCPYKPLYILTESLYFQHDRLAKIAIHSGYRLFETEGLVQVFKYKSGNL